MASLQGVEKHSRSKAAICSMWLRSMGTMLYSMEQTLPSGPGTPVPIFHKIFMFIRLLFLM